MAAPHTDHRSVRGWRADFKCWWKMAKYVDVVFDKSRNAPGSTSICRECCQSLSTRTCTGETEPSAVGCKFHRENSHIPFAIKSAMVSARLRDMWKPRITMALFYIDPGKTDLMDVDWVKQIREDNDETKQPRKLYQHSETCLHGRDPISIVQGRGIEGIYWKRCDGRYFNALGEEIDVGQIMAEGDSMQASAGPLDDEKEFDGQKLAQLAWRRRNPDADPNEDEETRPKRKSHCMVM